MDNITTSLGTSLRPEAELRDQVRELGRLASEDDSFEDLDDSVKRLVHLSDETFATLEGPGLLLSHQAAAINLLCALIQRCSRSQWPELQMLLWSGQIWVQSFDLFLAQHHVGKPKVMRQLLVTLSSALSRRSLDYIDDPVITRTCRQLLQILIGSDSQTLIKPALQALAHFLSKDNIDVNKLAATHGTLLASVELGDNVKACQALIRSALHWVGKGDYGSSVAHLLSVLVTKTRESIETTGEHPESVHSLPLWVEPLVDTISMDEGNLTAYRAYIFPVLFEHSTTDFGQFLDCVGLIKSLESCAGSGSGDEVQNEANESILFAALQSGKELGFVQEGTGFFNDHVVYLPIRWLAQLLVRPSPRTRLAGLSLLLTSHTMTRPVPAATFKLLRCHLHHFHADTDPNFRGEVLSLMQRFMDRLRASTAYLARQSKATKLSPTVSLPLNSGEPEKTRLALGHHKASVHWYLTFLAGELRPTASYQRHISALKCLMVVARSGVDATIPSKDWSKSALGQTKWPLQVVVVDASLRRQLEGLLMNPFDDVRQGAAALLSLCSTDSYFSKSPNNAVLLTVDRAEAMMLASGRADQADGVAHMYAVMARQCEALEPGGGPWWKSVLGIADHLVTKTEQMILIAERDQSAAVSQHPLHGLFVSLRYVLSETDVYASPSGGSCQKQWRRLHARTIGSVQKLWTIVHDILCNDAPEGYLPEDLMDREDVSTKDVLSYAWRALKESSSLIALIVSKAPLAGNAGIITEQDLQILTGLCFTQLVELRHRGAFSTVAQTFVACCQRLNDPSFGHGRESILGWYQKALECVQNKTTINTRRSAGLPALLCGILVADRSGGLVSMAVRDLTNVAAVPVHAGAEQSGSLSQAHALNCLKDIFKNTRLGDQSTSHVPATLELAAGCLESQIWAIRNCGLMLFRALIDRLLGTNDAYIDGDVHSASRLSLDLQPKLLKIIMRLLSEAQRSSEPSQAAGEGVFLALQLIQRASVGDDHREVVLEAVRNLMACKSWHVRDKAARTYTTLLPRNALLQVLADLLGTSTEKQNALHGALLCAKYVIRSLVSGLLADHSSFQHLVNGIHLLVYRSSRLYTDNPCHFTQAAYVDLFSEYPMQNLHQPPIAAQSELVALTRNSAARNIASGPLRKSLARVTPTWLVYSQQDDEDEVYEFSTLITELACLDTDACGSFLHSVSDHLGNQAEWPNRLSVRMFEVCTDLLLRNFEDAQVKTAAQDVLLKLLSLNGADTDYQMAIHNPAGIVSAIQGPQQVRGSPAYANGWIQLQAAVLDHRFGIGVRTDKEFLQELAGWVEDASMALQGTAIFSHEAAALGLSRFNCIWKAMAEPKFPQSLLLSLCLLTYDLLNDDDEDTRELAARVTYRILTADGNRRARRGFVPSVASQRLTACIIGRWSQSPELARTAFSRGFGMETTGLLSVEEKIKKVETIDTALFAEEKQNLYIDDVREARLWSHVILRVVPSAVPRDLILALARWTIEGLAYLTAKANSQVDGALGWTTMPEVFTIGLQVIFAAQVLLSLRRGGVKAPARTSEIHRKLHELAVAGTRSGMNGLWLREIEKTLEGSVFLKLGRICNVLRMIASTSQPTTLSR